MVEERGPEVPFPLGTEVPFPLSGSDRDGGSYPSAPHGYGESRGRATYTAARIGTMLFITAEGDLLNRNQIADLRQMPWRIYPPHFGCFVYTPEITLPAIRHFKFTEHFGYPSGPDEVVVHDVDGPHQIRIVDAATAGLSTLVAQPAGDATRSTGYGKSLQEAFDSAVLQLPGAPADIADALARYVVIEQGRLVGGIVGFDTYFATVELR